MCRQDLSELRMFSIRLASLPPKAVAKNWSCDSAARPTFTRGRRYSSVIVSWLCKYPARFSSCWSLFPNASSLLFEGLRIEFGFCEREKVFDVIGILHCFAELAKLVAQFPYVAVAHTLKRGSRSAAFTFQIQGAKYIGDTLVCFFYCFLDFHFFTLLTGRVPGGFKKCCNRREFGERNPPGHTS